MLRRRRRQRRWSKRAHRQKRTPDSLAVSHAGSAPHPAARTVGGRPDCRNITSMRKSWTTVGLASSGAVAVATERARRPQASSCSTRRAARPAPSCGPDRRRVRNHDPAARTAAGTGLLAWASSVLREGRNRSRPSAFDPVAHNRRNRVGRGFCRRDHWRGAATRHDTLGAHFLLRAAPDRRV